MAITQSTFTVGQTDTVLVAAQPSKIILVLRILATSDVTGKFRLASDPGGASESDLTPDLLHDRGAVRPETGAAVRSGDGTRQSAWDHERTRRRAVDADLRDLVRGGGLNFPVTSLVARIRSTRMILLGCAATRTVSVCPTLS